MTHRQIQAIKMVADAVIEAVQAAGSFGAPGGVIYAGLMAFGCTLQQYESIMSALVQAGKLTRKGQLYFAV